MAPYKVRRLFIGGSLHGEFKELPESFSDTVEVPVQADIRSIMQRWEPTTPDDMFRQTFRTERYEIKKLAYLSPTSELRITAHVMVVTGEKRYVSGTELHDGFAKWAIETVLYDAGLSTVRPPRYPL